MNRVVAGQDCRRKSDRRSDYSAEAMKAIEAAMRHDEISVLFQPQFSAENGKLIGAEALSRWNHPELGLIGAETLFGSGMKVDCLRKLTRHVLRSALDNASRWDNDLRVSVNIDAADLAGRAFPDAVQSALEDSGFPAGRLTLEITEQSLVDELDRSAERLERLAALGIRIALDDFGAGFCNFRYLQRLPLHCLKLDRSLVEGIDSNPRDVAVLRGILAMASALGLDVIAEGIEREGQLEVVSREGCAAWQGYLGARPLGAARFAEFATGFRR